jgi:osmotically-inducible protein OsmY
LRRANWSASSPLEPCAGAGVGSGPRRNVASDRAVCEALIAELEQQPWSRRAESNIVVSSGVVHLWGVVDSEPERQALRIAAEGVPGVRSVEDHTSVLPVGAF